MASTAMAEAADTGDVALVGEIGSTNVRFALVPAAGPPRCLQSIATLYCAAHEGLASAIESYLASVGGVRAREAAIAVAARADPSWGFWCYTDLKSPAESPVYS